MTPNFHAAFISIEDMPECFQIGFADREFGTQDYLMLQRAHEFDESGQVLNAQHAQKRATDYLRSYCVRGFKVEPPYEAWELELHEPPPLKDLK